MPQPQIYSTFTAFLKKIDVNPTSKKIEVLTIYILWHVNKRVFSKLVV